VHHISALIGKLAKGGPVMIPPARVLRALPGRHHRPLPLLGAAPGTVACWAC